MRRRSWALDIALALAVWLAATLTVLVEVPPVSDGRGVARLVTGALAGLAMLVRRRRPLWLAAAAALDSVAFGEVSGAAPFAAYAVARYGPLGRGRWVALGTSGAVVAVPWEFGSVEAGVNNLLGAALLFVLPAVVGAWLRTRAELLVALRERAERAEREQEALAREAVLQERARITREMHDVVGHRVSLMVLHAGAIDMAADDAERVRRLAGQLQDTGRRSLAELRQLLGLLSDDGDAPLAPQPTLADVDELVTDARNAGLPVTLQRLGPERDLDPTVGRTAYRVVQEALTNASRHAPGGAVAVTLETRDAELAVRVRNGRPTRPAEPLPGGGLGLVGLRERVRTVSGTLRAEPRLDGGFEVEAVMPG